jgi:hypothetical protein
MLDYKKIKSEFTKKLAEFNETKLLSWVKFDKTKQEYKYIGKCTGNNGNGCFLNSPGHNCGCFTRVPKEEAKPHSFCETPEEKCTMNYCDDNGCQNRKRELVEPQEKPKQVWEQIIETCGGEEAFMESAGLKPKQETLKESIERLIKLNRQDAFYEGAKWQQEQTFKQKLVIELNEYDYTGSSNDIYGMVVKVNGVEMPYHNLDVSTILEEVLEHLGYEVEIIETLDR